jgi:hypothetical protein
MRKSNGENVLAIAVSAHVQINRTLMCKTNGKNSPEARVCAPNANQLRLPTAPGRELQQVGVGLRPLDALE